MRLNHSSHLWLRLYAHALLRESRIFPNVELYDKLPDYVSVGFADIWMGNYHTDPICIKVIRTLDPVRLMEIKKVRNSFVLSEAYSTHSILDPPS